MFTFFEISTEENWMDNLWNAIDSVGYDQAPIKNNNLLIALIFIAFIFIVNFFVMNLFVSVIVDKFN